MNRRTRIAAVALPLLALVFMIGQAEWHLRTSDTWLLPINGYDPRDPLRGHYLLFRLRLDRAESSSAADACALDDPDCCFCLSPGESVPSLGFEAVLSRQACTEAEQQCSAFVRTRPLEALDRFYIPESDRHDLQRMLWDAAARDSAYLEVAVDARGEPAIRRMLVDGVELLEAEAEAAKTDPAAGPNGP